MLKLTQDELTQGCNTKPYCLNCFQLAPEVAGTGRACECKQSNVTTLTVLTHVRLLLGWEPTGFCPDFGSGNECLEGEDASPPPTRKKSTRAQRRKALKQYRRGVVAQEQQPTASTSHPPGAQVEGAPVVGMRSLLLTGMMMPADGPDKTMQYQ